MIDKIKKSPDHIPESVKVKSSQRPEEKAQNPANIDFFKAAVSDHDTKKPEEQMVSSRAILAGGKDSEKKIVPPKVPLIDEEHPDKTQGKQKSMMQPKAPFTDGEHPDETHGKQKSSAQLIQEKGAKQKSNTQLIKEWGLKEKSLSQQDEGNRMINLSAKTSIKGKKSHDNVSQKNIDSLSSEKQSFEKSKKANEFEAAVKKNKSLGLQGSKKQGKQVTSSQDLKKIDNMHTTIKSETTQQKTMFHEATKGQFVSKQGETASSQSQRQNLETRKDKKIDKDIIENVDVSGIKSTAAQQFSAQMTQNVNAPAPVDRQAVLDQVNKISDYISAQLNNAGETQSITIKFKDDVLPGTSLTLNKVEDGAFELNFESNNDQSKSLIDDNQSDLLESLNNNTQNMKFRVKMDREKKQES